MKLNTLFPNKKAKKKSSSSGKKSGKDLIREAKEKARASRVIPGNGVFDIDWPDLWEQKPKDYKVVTDIEEFKEYLRKCKRTGLAGFDWETAPTEEERKRFTRYEKDFKARMAAAKADENKSLIKTLNGEYEERKEEFLKSPLDPWKGEICTLSISAEPHEARVVFISHKNGERNFMSDLPRKVARDLLLDTLEAMILEQEDIVKVAYNLSFETKYALKYGKYILEPVADPMVMLVRCQQVVDPKKIKSERRPATGKGLKSQTKELFGVEMGNFRELLDSRGVEFFDEVSTDDPTAVKYSAEDSDYALQHYIYWEEVAKQIPNKNELYPTYLDWLNKIEMPFQRVIGQMEYWGMKANEKRFIEQRQEAHDKQEEAQEIIKDIARENFGIEVDPGKSGKTGDVKDLMYKKMKLPIAQRTDKGNISLNKYAIEDTIFMLENKLEDLDEEEYLGTELPDDWEERDPETDKNLTTEQRKLIRIKKRPDHPYKEAGIKLMETLQKIQKYSTLLSSHIKGREKYINPVSGRIHARYTAWTRTSRLNSSKPNGQNIPRPDNDEFGIRSLYQAEEGKVLIFADFSGFELRIMAWKSGDETMTELFLNNGDMHRKTAATLTGKPEEEVTKEERTHAKPGNFSISYGGTEHAIQNNFRDYGIRKSLPECKKVYDAVNATYPKIAEYQQDMITIARDQGYVETIYGYKRVLKDINSTNKYNRQSDERRASNTPIQGSASDIMKKAQNEVYEKVGKAGWHGTVDQVAQIHDEVVLEVDDDKKLIKEVVEPWLKETMEKEPLPDFPLPILVDVEGGYDYGNKKDLDEFLETESWEV